MMQELRDTQKQLLDSIDNQTKTEGTNNRMIQELRDKHQQLLDSIDNQTKRDERNNRMMQELRDTQKQLQDTLDNQTKTVAPKKPTVLLPCGQQEEVSTCRVEAITTVKGPKSYRVSI
jgi:seryl-tRNA synthetase